VLAFLAILVAGVCGALIGSSLSRVGCTGNCGTSEGVGAVVGASIAAIGVAVIAVLVLRAMGEWRTIKDERALQSAAVPPASGNQSGPGAGEPAGTGPTDAVDASPTDAGGGQPQVD